MFLAAARGFVTPVASGSQVRAFLGGHSGKLVYTKYEGDTGIRNGRSLWYLDFGEEQLVEHRILQTTDVEPRKARISPNGIWVTYSTWAKRAGNKLYLCRLAENTPSADIAFIGEGAQPSWWTKPGTTEEYIIYTSADIEDLWQQLFPSQNKLGGGGVTYCQQISNGKPVGSGTQLIPHYANGGRSASGTYLFASSRATGVYRLPPGATSNAQILESIAFDTTIWGCNPSVSPHTADSAVRIMWLNIPHDSIYVARPTGQITTRIARLKGSDSIWDAPCWSNHTDYAAAVASDSDVMPPFDVFLLRISDGAQLKVLDGNYFAPCLWVSPGTGVRDGRGGGGKGADGGPARWLGVAVTPPGVPRHQSTLYGLDGRICAARGGTGIRFLRAASGGPSTFHGPSSPRP